MTQEIVIPYVRGKIADGVKRFDFDIVARMVIEYDRVSNERDELLTELAEAVEVHARIMAEECPSDEYHCTCVPALRAEINHLTATCNSLKERNEVLDGAWTTANGHRDALIGERDDLALEVDALKAENKRLRAALETIVNSEQRANGNYKSHVEDIAREALAVAP